MTKADIVCNISPAHLLRHTKCCACVSHLHEKYTHECTQDEEKGWCILFRLLATVDANAMEPCCSPLP